MCDPRRVGSFIEMRKYFGTSRQVGTLLNCAVVAGRCMRVSRAYSTGGSMRGVHVSEHPYRGEETTYCSKASSYSSPSLHWSRYKYTKACQPTCCEFPVPSPTRRLQTAQPDQEYTRRNADAEAPKSSGRALQAHPTERLSLRSTAMSKVLLGRKPAPHLWWGLGLL